MEGSKLIEFHVKQAKIKLLKHEVKSFRTKVVKTIEEADNDQLRQLRISIAAKRAQVELKREELRARAATIAETKERFQEERNRELSEFKNIFTAFNDKLKSDTRTDSENR